jgi:predicted enzyme related to lactoylglutathione lyase
VAVRYAHTNIVAEDWRRVAAFYRAVFACAPVPPERDQSGDWLARATGVPGAALRGVHLRLPGHGESGPTLEIYSYATTAEGAPEPAANRKGLGHLAFEVDDVAATLAQIEAHGGSALGEVTVREIEGVGTITFVYAADPEGNILEIQAWS